MDINNNGTLRVHSRRVAAQRTKDPHFDALCETYEDLGRQVDAYEMIPGATLLEAQRLKRQRASCLDTILFMLDDSCATHRNAA